MSDFFAQVLTWFALPQVGLSAVFLSSFISATILPMASEGVLLLYVQAVPTQWLIALLLATLGNTLGSMVTYYMARAAAYAYQKYKKPSSAASQRGFNQAQAWIERYGTKVLLFSWLPVIGDVLCWVAGWKRLNVQVCVAYITVGKFIRYFLLLTVLQNWMS